VSRFDEGGRAGRLQVRGTIDAQGNVGDQSSSKWREPAYRMASSDDGFTYRDEGRGRGEERGYKERAERSQMEQEEGEKYKGGTEKGRARKPRKKVHGDVGGS